MRDGKAISPGGNWVKDGQVWVPGDPNAGSRSDWRVAVLEIETALKTQTPTPFLIGWRTREFPAAEFYSAPVVPWENKLGMRVGPDDVWFIVRSLDGTTPLNIKVIKVTTQQDPEYVNLPLY